MSKDFQLTRLRKGRPGFKPRLSEEYRYVYSDLRRIATLAGVVFIVLIALSFVIK